MLTKDSANQWAEFVDTNLTIAMNTRFSHAIVQGRLLCQLDLNDRLLVSSSDILDLVNPSYCKSKCQLN